MKVIKHFLLALMIAGILCLSVEILILAPVQVKAMTCHELSMSYILADQDKPEEPGDRLFLSEVSSNCPKLYETTAYCEGTHGSHGDRMREGFCAASPEMYGEVVMIYEAIPQEDGTYQIGEYIDLMEVRDTGYGYSTHKGSSAVRDDKKYCGTIEKGIHLDVYRVDLSRCKDWMRRTNGKVFAYTVKGVG